MRAPRLCALPRGAYLRQSVRRHATPAHPTRAHADLILLEAPRSRLAPAIAFPAFLVTYVALRTALLPADVAVTAAFTHDSGYIGIVARNLLAGRGYVNDADWLLFLNPPSLPMYFHNANPLYPSLTAGVMRVTGWDPARSAAFLSIIGSALAALGTYALVLRFRRGRAFAAACGLLVLAFPASWRISFSALPDALATGLVLCLFAVVVRARAWWHWAGAGVLFGLAWLTRSSVSVVLPAVGVWILMRHGLRRALGAGVVAGASALLVASPWLVHTARVRGGPFRSDASYYWLIDYHAGRTHRLPDEYYRSLEPPPSAATVLRDDAAGVARAAITGLPFAVYRAVAGLAEWDKLAAFLLLCSAAAGLFVVARRAFVPELAAGALVWAATFGALAIRGRNVEIRYFSVSTVLLCLLLAAPLALPADHRYRRRLRLPLAAYLLVSVLPQDWRIAQSMLGSRPELVAFREGARTVDASLPDSAAVISHLPYFFTYYTGRRSVSPPYPDKASLLRVMDRYGVSSLLLPTDSLGYYYPPDPGALAPELAKGRRVGRFTLLQRVHPTS